MGEARPWGSLGAVGTAPTHVVRVLWHTCAVHVHDGGGGGADAALAGGGLVVVRLCFMDGHRGWRRRHGGCCGVDTAVGEWTCWAWLCGRWWW